MKKVIQDFDVQEDEEELKEWYDGYTIGNTEGIYNPWSVLNFLAKKQLMPYWVNTSSNDLIKLTLKKSSTIKEKIERLLKDEPIEVKVDLEAEIVNTVDNIVDIWGLLVGQGYLKVVETVNLVEQIYKVQIPNRETKKIFRSII